MAENTVPLLSVFWDVENCRIPRGKSALTMVHAIRSKFLTDGHKEAEFLCVCDVFKEHPHLVSQLNDAQVTVVHVSSEHKNAADEKLKQCMRRFCDSHVAPVTVVLISGDVDFAADLSHMRHTHRYKIILVHNNASLKQALAIAADEIFKFDDIVQEMPREDFNRLSDSDSDQDVHWVKITNLPNDVDLQKLRTRLSMLVNNTKGRIIHSTRKMAIAQYSQPSWAQRAAKRMNRQDVFGSKITACHVSNVTNRKPNALPAGFDQYEPSFQTNTLITSGDSGSILPDFPTPPDSATLRTANKFPPSNTQIPSPSLQQTPQKQPLQLNHSQTFSRTPGSKKHRPTSINNPLIASTPQTSQIRYAGVSKQYPRIAQPYNQWGDQRAWNIGNSFTSQPRFAASYNYFPVNQPQTFQPSGQSTFRPIQLNEANFGDGSSESGYYSNSQVGTGYRPPTLDCQTGPRAITGQTKRTPLYKRASPVSPAEAKPCEGVALSVTNLDYNITAREWRKILHQTFQQYVQVLNVEVQTQQDGSCAAQIFVPTQEEARHAISQCHRKKIGYKRIQVSVHSPSSPHNAQRIRSEVKAILSEVTACTLPLFKFIELYEKRFFRTISVSELYHMKDTVEIKDHSGKGRTVCLQLSSSPSPSSSQFSSNDSPIEPFELDEKPYCTLHCSSADFMLMEESGMLPYVKIELSKLTQNVHTLVKLHDGDLPLLSFTHCYESAFAKLSVTNDGGVPLEHLISCVPNIQIKTDSLGVKRIVWVEARPTSPANSSYSENSCSSNNDSSSIRTGQSLSQLLSQFSREVVDLLKRMPACQMSFSKFIPSYHHHFGRQCRVADFGFTKLQELFEAIPHVLQILGTGNQKVLYLTHRIHVRRFTADLCRVLKAQPDKQCTVTELPDLYSEVMGSDLEMSNFGVCYIDDMLYELADSQVVVANNGRSTIISIPRKDQTEEEIERTKQFSYEVIDLLRNCPQCTMAFNKFIPSYHHHFGRQCRVADFGFSKLIELFEAIPDILNISERGEDRFISLTKSELLKVLSEQILALLKACPMNSIEIKELNPAYHRLYGHNIYIEEFGVESLDDLITKISHIACMESREDGDYVVLNNRQEIEVLAKRSLELLIEKSNGEMRLSRFLERYLMFYEDHPDLVRLKHELYPAILIKEDAQSGTIYLHPLLSLTRRIKLLLNNNQGKLTLLTFEMAYRQSFGISIDTKKCGLPGVSVMLQMMDFMVSIRGRGARQTILLRQDYLSRLAHQLSYKIGIYTEIAKYKELDSTTDKATPSSNGSTHKPNLATNLTEIKDTSYMNDSIQACSPDLFLCNAAEKAFEDTPPNITISPVDEGCLSPDLFNACRMLSTLNIDTESSSHSSGTAACSILPQAPSPLPENTPSPISRPPTLHTTTSPRRYRIAAAFDK